MANIVLKNAYVMINAVDLSDHVKSVTINYKAELLDDTAMGDDGRSRIAGLLDWDADVEFFQDYASAKVDATLFPLVGAAAFAVKIRAVNGAIATTNPEYQGNAVLESYQPVGGSVGDNAMTPCKLLGGDGSVLVRDVTP